MMDSKFRPSFSFLKVFLLGFGVALALNACGSHRSSKLDVKDVKPELHEGSFKPLEATVPQSYFQQLREQERKVGKGANETHLGELTVQNPQISPGSTQPSLIFKATGLLKGKQIEFDLYGVVNDEGTAVLLPRRAEKGIATRARATCLEKDASGRWDWKGALFIDVYAELDGVRYTDQLDFMLNKDESEGTTGDAPQTPYRPSSGDTHKDSTKVDVIDESDYDDRAYAPSPKAIGRYVGFPNQVDDLFKTQTPVEWMSPEQNSGRAPSPTEQSDSPKPNTTPDATAPAQGDTTTQAPKESQTSTGTAPVAPAPVTPVDGTQPNATPGSISPTAPAPVAPPANAAPSAQAPAQPAAPPKAQAPVQTPPTQAPATPPKAPAPTPQPSTTAPPKATTPPAAKAGPSMPPQTTAPPPVTTPPTPPQAQPAPQTSPPQQTPPKATAPAPPPATPKPQPAPAAPAPVPAPVAPAPAKQPPAPAVPTTTIPVPPPKAEPPKAEPPKPTPPKPVNPAPITPADDAEAGKAAPSDARQTPAKDPQPTRVTTPVPEIPKPAPKASGRPWDQANGTHRRGWLEKASALDPASLLYQVLSPNERHYFGTQLMVEFIERLAKLVTSLVPGYRLQVKDISSKNGGRLGSHGSHQIGLDADIAYIIKNPLNSFVSIIRNKKMTSAVLKEEQWEVFKRAAQTNTVNFIFVDRPIKTAFCQHARETGDFDTEVGIQALRRLWVEPGHDDHWHLRLKCNEENPRCRDESDPPNQHGCK